MTFAVQNRQFAKFKSPSNFNPATWHLVQKRIHKTGSLFLVDAVDCASTTATVGSHTLFHLPLCALDYTYGKRPGTSNAGRVSEIFD